MKTSVLRRCSIQHTLWAYSWCKAMASSHPWNSCFELLSRLMGPWSCGSQRGFAKRTEPHRKVSSILQTRTLKIRELRISRFPISRIDKKVCLLVSEPIDGVPGYHLPLHSSSFWFFRYCFKALKCWGFSILSKMVFSKKSANLFIDFDVVNAWTAEPVDDITKLIGECSRF